MAPSLSDVMTADAAELARAQAGAGRAPLPEAQADLFEGLLRIGDSTLILAQRVSEWVAHTPVLEEDIAIANVALDLLGQAQLWLALAGDVEGAGRDADALAFRRDAWDFRNLLLVERPNGDYGHTLMRQFLFDAWHLPFLRAAMRSCEGRIAEIAAKAEKEVAYHFERSADLVIRLGDGTEESRARMQAALERLWPYVGEMFTPDALDQRLAEAGLLPDLAALRPEWEATLAEVLAEATLTRPSNDFAQLGGRQGRHTEHLGHLLCTMQWLQRAYPDAEW